MLIFVAACRRRRAVDMLTLESPNGLVACSRRQDGHTSQLLLLGYAEEQAVEGRVAAGRKSGALTLPKRHSRASGQKSLGHVAFIPSMASLFPGGRGRGSALISCYLEVASMTYLAAVSADQVHFLAMRFSPALAIAATGTFKGLVMPA
eukprot:4530166-Pleurochrysis_carterae.AAC.1